MTSPKIDWDTLAKFRVYRAAPLNSASVETKVNFDTVSFDVGSHITTNNRFTATEAGHYFFTGRASNVSASATTIAAILFKNGASMTSGSGSTSAPTGQMSNVSDVVHLDAGDYVELYFVGGNGSTMNVGSANCFFSGFQISRD